MKWLILLLGIASNASASLLIKLALHPASSPLSLAEPWRIFGSVKLLLGILLYGLALILYALALRYFPLNVAHPILTTGAMTSVALLSVVVLQESLRPNMIFGLAFMGLGIVLLASGQR